MQKYILTFIGLIGFVILTLFLIENPPTSQNQSIDQTKETSNAFPMGIGDEENPEARFQYEFDRLKDPKTGEIPKNIRKKELAFSKQLPKKAAKTALESEWVQRGPFNAGGRTRAAALDISNEETILIGGVTSGLYKSIDGGASFALKSNISDLHSVTAIVQDTRAGKTDTWYYGTGEYYGVVSAASFSSQTSGNGIYKSSDGGETWSILPSTELDTPQDRFDGAFDIVWRIVIDPTASEDKEVVLAAVRGGVMRSEDGGTSWEGVLGFPEDIEDSADYSEIIVSPSGVFYAALGRGYESGSAFNGVYRSENGIDWTEISPSPWSSFNRRSVMALNPCNENELYLLVNAPSASSVEHGLWKGTVTDNGTVDWENRSANLPDGDCQYFYTFEFGKFSSQNSYDMAIAVSPDCETLFLGGTNVYRASDGFATGDYDWIGGYQCDTLKPSNYVWPKHHPDQHFFLFEDNDPNVLYSANDGGFYKTENAMDSAIVWQDLNNGYIASQYYTIEIEPGETDNDIVIGGTQDNGTWMTLTGNPDEDWLYKYIGDGAYCAIPEGREYVYMSWQRGRIFKFQLNEDGTTNAFTRIDHAEPISTTVFINPFILDPLNANTMYVCHGPEMWRNTKLDEIALVGNETDPLPENWEEIELGDSFFESQITCLAMSKAHPNRLFYGLANGNAYYVDHADGTTGETEKVKIMGVGGGNYVSSIALDESNPNQILVSISNYNTESLWYTDDFGENWRAVGGNLEDTDVSTATTGPAVFGTAIHNGPDGQVFFAGTSIGLYSTQDIDADPIVWEQEGAEAMGNSIINMIKTRSFDNRVAVATHGNGIFSNGTLYEAPPVIGLEGAGDSELISELKIGPNPFKERVRISWNQLENAPVDLKIVNMEGKTVAELFKGELPRGEQTFYWDGIGANGVFLVSVQVGNQRFTRRIVKG